MSAEIQFIRWDDDEILFEKELPAGKSYLVINYESQPNMAVVAKSLERDIGALIFGFYAHHVEKTQDGIRIPRELINSQNLVEYIPLGFQARYDMVSEDGTQGTFTIAPKTPNGFLN